MSRKNTGQFFSLNIKQGNFESWSREAFIYQKFNFVLFLFFLYHQFRSSITARFWRFPFFFLHDNSTEIDLIWCDGTTINIALCSSHQVTSDVSLAETCRAAELFMSDGIIITGSSTGESASPSDFKSAQSAVSLPVILGSGVTAANVEEFASAQALIVGSYFKEKGHWANELCRNRIDLLVSAVRNYADR